MRKLGSVRAYKWQTLCAGSLRPEQLTPFEQNLCLQLLYLYQRQPVMTYPGEQLEGQSGLANLVNTLTATFARYKQLECADVRLLC